MKVFREQTLKKMTAPNNKLRAAAKNNLMAKFKVAKRQLQGNFFNHPVSKEIEDLSLIHI